VKRKLRILLTGRNGQVGWELERALACLGELHAFESKTLDLRNENAIRETVRKVKPNIIVNSAAYTQVDKAESELDVAELINSIAPGILAEEAERLDALLVHYSTDYVFNGTGDQPWKETDATDPINVYGRSKLAGESAVRAHSSRHLIFRLSWVYATRGQNFLLTMQRLMRERESLRVVSDQIGAPTWSRMIAEASAAVLARLIAEETIPAIAETFHMASQGHGSWHDFARLIQDTTPNAVCREIEAITSAEYPTSAQRPLNSRLDCSKLASHFDIVLPDWRDALLASIAP
jgi:dTDP-4-dehydrorhamnose reductase